MRDVVLYTLMSLDGAADDPRRYFAASDLSRSSAPVLDPVLDELEARLVARQDAVLLGRGMHDEWSRYWPTASEQPFADFINTVPKYVVTSSPLTGSWPGAQAVTGRLADIVADLKAQPGKDIGVHGSLTLARSLLAEGLVDVLHLAVGPVLDPGGRRLFPNDGPHRALQLESATPTPAGALWLTYRAG